MVDALVQCKVRVRKVELFLDEFALIAFRGLFLGGFFLNSFMRIIWRMNVP